MFCNVIVYSGLIEETDDESHNIYTAGPPLGLVRVRGFMTKGSIQRFVKKYSKENYKKY